MDIKTLLHQYELEDFNPVWSFIRGIYYFILFPFSHEFKAYLRNCHRKFVESYNKRILDKGPCEEISVALAISRLEKYAENLISFNGMRKGQAVSTIIYYKLKDIYYIITGSDLDPFYKTENLDVMYKWMRDTYTTVNWRM